MAKLYVQRVIEAGHPQTTNLGSLQASAQAYASLIAGVLVGQEISGKRCLSQVCCLYLILSTNMFCT